jgi:type IV pilus assembly protein PilA
MNNKREVLMKSKGFTLVEFIIVLVIVGVLSIIAIPVYKGYVVKSKIAKELAGKDISTCKYKN